MARALRILAVALLASFAAEGSRAAPADDVRARLSAACRCEAREGRFHGCAKRVTQAALRGGSPSGGVCRDDRAVADVRALLSSACGIARSEGGSQRCARRIARAALRAGPVAAPLPPPVPYAGEPGVGLGDPAFEPMPGARADFGRLGGAVYQIEMPERWNGRLVLHMHGYEEYGAEATVAPPDLRAWLILHGYAWGASSFSSTAWIAGRSADETAALWDFFTRRYGRPCFTYVTGISMGGAASHVAAERYPDRFDGSLALCGATGFEDGAKSGGNYVAAGAYVAGITRAEFDASPSRVALIAARIRPALADPVAHARFEDLLLQTTGGPRAFDREGFHAEEATNWRRAQMLLAAGIAKNADTVYPDPGLDAAAVRLATNEDLLRTFSEGNETTGAIAMPLLSLYTTGDGQVPIEQSRALRRRADAAGRSDLLVQRVFRDAGHCGFSTEEQEASFQDLVRWVERGEKPAGDDVLVDDLRTLDGRFERSPRPGTPEADTVPGAADRVVLTGRATLDGAPFDAPFLGAVVRRDGLVAPCQYTLPSVQDGHYEITVLADAEVSGCGAPGAEIALWTFASGTRLWSGTWVPWPGGGATAPFDAAFTTSAPEGAVPPTSDFLGEVFRGGERLPHGTPIEAYVGRTLCGVASTRRTGSYGGYILSVVGPDSVAGCTLGAPLRFRVGGERATTTVANAPDAGSALDLLLPGGRGDRCVAGGAPGT
jgi:hypothetical protein